MLERVDPELLEGLKKLQAAMPLGGNLADDLPSARAAAAARNSVLFSNYEMPENVTLEILTVSSAQGHDIDLRMMRPKALAVHPGHWSHQAECCFTGQGRVLLLDNACPAQGQAEYPRTHSTRRHGCSTTHRRLPTMEKAF